jgi:hypothetical protein
MERSFGVRPARISTESNQSDQKLCVVVLFTTAPATLLALKSAAKLADGLSARIRVVVPCIVPYHLPLDKPPVDPCVFSRSLCAMAQQAGVDCTIDIRLCREPWTAFRQAIPARSLVMIGVRPRWWDFRERKLGEQLRREGHQVAYAK